MKTPGSLYVVATPIGNMGDISARACEVLAAVDFIAAEDTRHTGGLLQKLGIKRPLVSYHDHNERGRSSQIVERLKAGEDAALVSDAGTPTISDPGYRLVRACREEELAVLAVPGASALLAALSISGLPTDRFCFEGFLPPKGKKREDRVSRILGSDCTSIIYESPHRLLKLVNSIATIDPEREIVITRELTKRYEEALHGPSSELEQQLVQRKSIKGEIVVLIRGVG